MVLSGKKMSGPNYEGIIMEEGVCLATAELFPVPSARDPSPSSVSHTHFLQALPNGLSVGADNCTQIPPAINPN